MTRSTWLLGLVALLGCLSPSWADTTTLAIPTVLIKLTIKKLRGGRNLLRGQEHQQLQQHQRQSANQLLDEGRRLQSIDSTVQSVAERHLSSVYADAFSLPPDQVLLTVVTDEEDEEGGGSSGGIYVRSSFLGGVVTFPANRAQSPSRSQLEEVTVAAFKVPGAAGEDFLEALIDTDHPELAGLLLVDASSVTRPSDGNEGDGVAVQHDDGSSSGGTSMNIWAVAAVAALGAMFLVIVLCTSILYCDWRKRRDRRERKRDRAVAVASANHHHHHNGKGYNRMNSKKSSNKSYKADEDGIEVVPFEESLQQPALQIVVPSGSGETEEINTPSPKSNGDNEFNPDPANVSGTPEKKGLMGKLKSSRRGLGSKVVKSKAVERQLQDAQSPPSSSSNHHLNSPAAPSVGYQMSEDEFGLPGAAQSVADYSVGEDTTMLYPSVNRGRTTSRDNESEFDGYSMDGMSAIGDGMGLSQYGGSAGGSGAGGASARKGGRDVYYSGEVPRDFDSVWGDDDQSKITMGDTSLDLNDTVNDTNKRAYGDLTKNLDELVELGESEERSGKGSNSIVSSSAGGENSSSVGINLHDFDSESESGSHRANFTLELLGGGKGARATTSAAGSAADDEDSILGGMYQDEASSVGMGAGSKGGEGRKVPSSGDSVDSTPSWAAPIQNALSRSMDIFRASPEKAEREEKDEEEEAASIARKDTDKDADDASTSEQSIEERTKEKLLSSIHGSDDASVGSNRSGRSNSSKSSASSRGSRGSKSKRDRTTAESAKDKALGLTNSMEEEVDEDPAAMIDNINSMLSECQEILDTDETPAEKV